MLHFLLRKGFDMAVSRFITEAELNPRIKLLKTILGLLVILVLIFTFLVLSAGSPLGGNTSAIAGREPAGAYVSAIYGQLGYGSDEALREVGAGDSLQLGQYYTTSPGSASLIRFIQEDSEILITGNPEFAAGTTLDPWRFNLISGDARLTVNSLSEQAFQLRLGELSVVPVAPGHYSYKHEEAERLRVYSGELMVSAGDSQWQLSAGGILLQEDEEYATDHFEPHEPPRLLSPSGGKIFRRNEEFVPDYEFTWRAKENAPGYLFQLARDRLFQNVLIARRTEAESLVVEDLPPDTYYWRVFVVDSGGYPVSPPADSMAFSVQSMRTIAEEAVSAPDLTIETLDVQGRSIIISGISEPGARIRVRIESYGEIIYGPVEFTVSNTEKFDTVIEAPRAGKLDVFVDAFYSRDSVTPIKRKVEVAQ